VTGTAEVVRTSWLLWRKFLVRENGAGAVVGRIVLRSSFFQLGGHVASVFTDGGDMVVRRTRWFGREYVLVCEGRPVAIAVRPSAFDETLVARSGGYECRLVPTWTRGRKDFEVRVAGRPAGGISCDSRLLRRAVADLPADMPVELRLLAICLALQNWRSSLHHV
jgi:hypothetical protein